MLKRVTETCQLCQLLWAAIGGRNDVQRRLKGERERVFTNAIERSIVILVLCSCVCWCVCVYVCVRNAACALFYEQLCKLIHQLSD